MVPTGGQEVACLDRAGGGDAEYGRDGARGSPRCNEGGLAPGVRTDEVELAFPRWVSWTAVPLEDGVVEPTCWCAGHCRGCVRQGKRERLLSEKQLERSSQCVFRKHRGSAAGSG